MIDEMEDRGGLDEDYSDHRGESSADPDFSISTAMTDIKKAVAWEGITGSEKEDDWGADPFFVICSDPSGEWKKVMIINTKSDVATFRSITESVEYTSNLKETIRDGANWWLDRSMMDANVQQMRVFQSQLRNYLA